MEPKNKERDRCWHGFFFLNAEKFRCWKAIFLLFFILSVSTPVTGEPFNKLAIQQLKIYDTSSPDSEGIQVRPSLVKANFQITDSYYATVESSGQSDEPLMAVGQTGKLKSSITVTYNLDEYDKVISVSIEPSSVTMPVGIPNFLLQNISVLSKKCTPEMTHYLDEIQKTLGSSDTLVEVTHSPTRLRVVSLDGDSGGPIGRTYLAYDKSSRNIVEWVDRALETSIILHLLDFIAKDANASEESKKFAQEWKEKFPCY